MVDAFVTGLRPETLHDTVKALRPQNLEQADHFAREALIAERTFQIRLGREKDVRQS